MKIPFLDLNDQYEQIKHIVIDLLREIFDSQRFILGENVNQFEKNFAEYCGTKYCVAVSSGTDALLAALMALEIGRGDEVILPDFTFFATAGVVARLGAKPVFVDIDPQTFNINPLLVKQAITPKTKAIIPVHIFGQCAEMPALLEIANEFHIPIIEDACQAVGAEYDDGNIVNSDFNSTNKKTYNNSNSSNSKDLADETNKLKANNELTKDACAEPLQNHCKRTGNLGLMGCFSFYPTKNLGGAGDSGAITTNDEQLYNKLKQMRNHGMEPRYFHSFIGGNFRMDEIQAAVLRVKLRHLEGWNNFRRINANFYNKYFIENDLVPNEINSLSGNDANLLEKTRNILLPYRKYENVGIANYHTFHQYSILANERDKLRKYLTVNEIGTDIYYPIPLHRQECFKEFGYSDSDFPVTNYTCAHILSLPIYPDLTQAAISEVVEKIAEFYKSF